MSCIVYEQIGFNSSKSLFMFIYLTTKSNSSLNLGSTVKKAGLQHNNAVVSIKLIYVYIILCI